MPLIRDYPILFKKIIIDYLDFINIENKSKRNYTKFYNALFLFSL